MADKNIELVFILDRSGSMEGLEGDTIGGFNSVLESHRKTGENTMVTTVLFDHEVKTLHDRLPIGEVAPMTKDDYQVRGCTALIDAMGSTIEHIEKIQRYMPEGHKAEKVIFVITTDGYENASSKFTSDQVKHMVEARKEEGWDFLFLGANIDAVETGARFGIDEDHAVTYRSDSVGTRAMYEAVGCAVQQCCAAPKNASMGSSWKRAIRKDRAKRG